MLFSGQPPTRLRVRRRVSSWSSRRRGPSRGKFDVGGGVFKHNTRRQTPTTFERSPTRRAAKAAMWRRRDRAVRGVLVSRCHRPGVQAAEFKMKELLMVGGTTNTFGKAFVAKPGDGGGSHEHIHHGQEQPGTQPGSGTRPETPAGVQAAEFDPRSPR